MASNFVRAAYREIIDLNTESNKVTAVGIHTPVGDTPRKMFPGFFQQYKKYKYKGCSIAFYPIAKLPADPLQVSYDAGEPGIDPRDLANPILVHGCHGNDMGSILNKLYGDNNGIADSMDRLDEDAIHGIGGLPSDPFYDTMERLYYKALTDMTWKKANVQRGFRKGGLRPLVYSLATNHQIMPSSIYPEGMELAVTGSPAMNGVLPTNEYEIEDDVYMENEINRSNVQFFTPRLTRLGWMDTRQVLTSTGQVAAPQIEGLDLSPLDVALNSSLVEQINWAQLPRLYMLMVLLPPAYKTEMYFRAIVTHYFQFKGFRGISFMPEQTGAPSMFTQEWSDTADGVVPDDFPDVPVDPPEGGVTPDPDPEPDPDPTPVENALTVTRGTVTVNDPDQEMSIRLQAFRFPEQDFVDVTTLYSGFASGWSGSKTASLVPNAQYRVVLTVDSVEGMLMKWTDSGSSPAPTTVESNSTATWVFNSASNPSVTIVMNGTMGE